MFDLFREIVIAKVHRDAFVFQIAHWLQCGAYATTVKQILSQVANYLDTEPIDRHLTGMSKPIHVRVDDDLRSAFDEALNVTGLGETQFVKAAIKAFVDYVQENGEVTVPLAILPKSKAKRPKKEDDFPSAGESKNADVAGVSTVSTQQSRPPDNTSGFSLNEDSPDYRKSSVPRAKGSRAALKGMVEKEKGKQK